MQQQWLQQQQETKRAFCQTPRAALISQELEADSPFTNSLSLPLR